MNVEQIEVFVQYACGDTVKVTVPAMSVGIPLVPAFTMPVIGECPEGTMAIPKTYVSEPYPVISNDMVQASSDVLDVFMKYIYQYPAANLALLRASTELTDVYFKNINVFSNVVEGISTSQELMDVYLKNINIYYSTNEDLMVASDIADITMIDLNRYYTVIESFACSPSIISGEIEPSPRTHIGTEVGDISVDSYSINAHFVSGVMELYASFDNLRGDVDAYSISSSFVSGNLVTYNSYSGYTDVDAYTMSVNFVSGTVDTYTQKDMSGDIDAYSFSASFIGGSIQNV